MNVMILGGGGRESSTGWRCMQPPFSHTVYVAPGNAGTALMGCHNIPLEPTPENHYLIREIAKQLKIDLIIVGPEKPLAQGIVNYIQPSGIPIFGPTMSGARIEWSKIFAHELMIAAEIPTAPAQAFYNLDLADALSYVIGKEGQVVVKADGLADGKGAIVSTDKSEALDAVSDLLGEKNGAILIQDRLEGSEMSSLWLVDTKTVKPLPILQDYKRLKDGIKEPMTGGMGVYGPLDVSESLYDEIRDTIVIPLVFELKRRGIEYRGCVYVGIMKTKDGLRVLEFNARFGDPETQVHMRLVDDSVDWAAVLHACTQDRLNQIELKWRSEKCVCVIAAAAGYPEKPRKGDMVHLHQMDPKFSDTVVFHSGTRIRNGKLSTDGNRILSVTTLLHDELKDADRPNLIDQAYYPFKSARVYFNDMQYRTDIGQIK